MDAILCNVDQQVNFNIRGESKVVDISDIVKEENLSRIYRIQFSSPPQKEQLDHVIKAIRKKPDIELRFYGNYSEDEIEWTKLVDIENLIVNLWEIRDLAAISSMKKLKRLGISKMVKSKVSLSVLVPLANLETLFTSISKDIEAIAGLTSLREISLDQIKNDNLNFLSNLNKLEKLGLWFGSYHDFTALAKIPNLKKMRICQVRGFEDEVANHVLSKCKNIKVLRLENLNHIINLDFVQHMFNLEHLSFEGVKNIKTYSPIRKNPTLTTIAGYHCRPINKSLKGLENLKNITLGDSYSKSEINTFLKDSMANNILIRGNILRGAWDSTRPFYHID